MAVLNWGKPKIEIALLGADGTPGAWTEVDTPKQDTTQLTTEKGDKKEALEEGGGVVDAKYNKSKYSLVFQLFAKKGKTKPIMDDDGVVLGNYAVRITPEDPTATGWQMMKCNVSVVDTWSAEEGQLWEYTFDGLVPDGGGKILQEYTAP
jgi:hypothetical protein